MEAELLLLPPSSGNDITVLAFSEPSFHRLDHQPGSASGAAPRHGQRRGPCMGGRCRMPASVVWSTIAPLLGGHRRWRASRLSSACRAAAIASAPVVQRVVERSRCSGPAAPACEVVCQRRGLRSAHRARAANALAPISCTCRLSCPAAQQGVEADAALALLAPRPCLRAQSCYAWVLQSNRRAA